MVFNWTTLKALPFFLGWLNTISDIAAWLMARTTCFPTTVTIMPTVSPVCWRHLVASLTHKTSGPGAAKGSGKLSVHLAREHGLVTKFLVGKPLLKMTDFWLYTDRIISPYVSFGKEMSPFLTICLSLTTPEVWQFPEQPGTRMMSFPFHWHTNDDDYYAYND